MGRILGYRLLQRPISLKVSRLKLNKLMIMVIYTISGELTHDRVNYYNLNGGCQLTWRFSASWHLYTRRVVMVVILSVWCGMSLANIQFLKLGYFRTSPLCWEPSIYCYSWADLFGFMKSVLWPELHWTFLNVNSIRYIRFNKSKLSNRKTLLYQVPP